MRKRLETIRRSSVARCCVPGIPARPPYLWGAAVAFGRRGLRCSRLAPSAVCSTLGAEGRFLQVHAGSRSEVPFGRSTFASARADHWELWAAQVSLTALCRRLKFTSVAVHSAERWCPTLKGDLPARSLRQGTAANKQHILVGEDFGSLMYGRRFSKPSHFLMVSMSCSCWQSR